MLTKHSLYWTSFIWKYHIYGEQHYEIKLHFWKKKKWPSCLGVKPHPSMDTWLHDDVINWKHFPRYWPFGRGIHRSPVNSLHKSQWRGALMVSLTWAWINGWVNNREAGDLRRHQAHYDVIVMKRCAKGWVWWIPPLNKTVAWGSFHWNGLCGIRGWTGNQAHGLCVIRGWIGNQAHGLCVIRGWVSNKAYGFMWD